MEPTQKPPFPEVKNDGSASESPNTSTQEKSQKKAEEGKGNNNVDKVMTFLQKIKKLIRKPNKSVIIIIVSILIVVFCFFAIVGLGAYKYSWDNGFVNSLTKALPYPAAIVDGSIIKLSDWKFEVAGVSSFNLKRFGEVDKSAVEKEVLEKMIMEKILEKMAKGYDVKATQEDIQLNLDALYEEVGSAEKLAQNVNDFFGWDMETFSERILYPEALRAKLIEKMSMSDRAVKQARVAAEKVLKEVEKGDKTFEELAEEYSDDPGSAMDGGDLGVFPRGVMVTEFEDAVFSLEPGQISDLVQTDFGFHVIKLINRIVPEEGAESEEGVEIGEEVEAKHILIAFRGYEDYLSEYREKSRIYKFVALDEK